MRTGRRGVSKARALSPSQQAKVRAGFVDAGMDSELTVERMAAEVGISRSISRLFRASFGVSLRYVLQMRIARAAHLLRAEAADRGGHRAGGRVCQPGAPDACV